MASRWNQGLHSSSRSMRHYPMSPESHSVNGSTRSTRQTSSDHYEPSPLNDNCARYVLSVMVLFLRPSPDHPLMLRSPFSDLTFRDFSHIVSEDSTENSPDTPITSPSHFTRPNGSILRPQSSSNSVKSGKMSLNSTIHIPVKKATYEKTHMSLVRSSTQVNTLIAKYAGRIVFHLSASNWLVVNERLRGKIHSLTKEVPENKDMGDLELIAHSALDRQRLVQLLIGRSFFVVCIMCP